MKIEFTRADDSDDSYKLPVGVVAYKLRRAAGVYAVFRVEWSREFLTALSRLYRGRADAAELQRFGDELRAQLHPVWAYIEIGIIHREAAEITVCSGTNDLYSIPLELLPDERSGEPLGKLKSVSLRYRWPDVFATSPDTGGDAGRCLFVWASAGGSVPHTEHQTALSGVPLPWLRFSKDDVLQEASLAALSNKLELAARGREGPIRVIHLLCHGQDKKEDHAYGLALHNPGDAAEIDFVDAARLASALSDYSSMIRLVVLCVCNSGESDAFGNHLGSVARALHRHGIPYVVASRFPLSVSASVHIATSLYQGLREGLRRLDRAVSETRRCLVEASGGHEWATLQLYVAPPRREDHAARRHNLPRLDGALVVGRDGELDELHRSLNQSTRGGLVGLVGMAGVGKSTLALEYAYRNMGRFKTVCWVDARGGDVIARVAALASDPLQLCLDESLPVGDRASRVRKELEASPCLLILDHVEDPGLLDPSSGAGPFLPNAGHSHIIVTSRSPLPRSTQLLVEPLAPADALRVIVGRSNYSDVELAAAERLVEELDRIPFALEVARGVLAAGRSTPSRMLRRLRSAGTLRYFESLSRRSGRPSIVSLFDASVCQLDQADLVDVWAHAAFRVGGYFAPSEIPEQLLGDAAARLLDEEVDPYLVEDATDRLVDLYLVRRASDRRLLFNHLSRRFARALGGDDAGSAVLSTLSSVAERTPTDSTSLLGLAAIRPHFETVINSIGDQAITSEQLLVGLRLVQHYRVVGEFQAALDLGARVERLVSGSWKAEFMNEVVACATALGQLDLAERRARALVSLTRSLHGSREHAEVAASYSGLATVLRRRAAYHEAEARLRECLEILERVTGRRNTRFASALCELAEVLSEQGRLEEAEKGFRTCGDIFEQTLGSREHFEVATSLLGLANVLSRRHEFAEAEQLYRESIALMCHIYGTRQHVQIATSLHGLANVQVQTERLDAAEKHYLECIDIYERVFNREHDTIASSLHGLGNIRFLQHRYEDARKRYLESIELRRVIHKTEEHDAIAASLVALANTQVCLGEAAEAEESYRSALAIQLRVFGTRRHLDVAATLHGLATLLLRSGSYLEAEEAFRESIEIQELLYGSRARVSVAKSLRGMVVTLRKLGRETEADALYDESAKIFATVEP